MKEVYLIEDLRDWHHAVANVDPPIRLSVFGDPVAHSASPPMQNAALAGCGIDASYARLHIRPQELAEALQLIVDHDFIGTNLTIPHKTAALPLVEEVDEHARRIGAINTIAVHGKKRIGFNTDGPGLRRAIQSEFSVNLSDLRVMVLGAGGGAGRAIAIQCALDNCERLVLVNRTFEKARKLEEEIASFFKGSQQAGAAARLEAVAWREELLREQLRNTDLVINATSAGMKPGDPSVLPGALLLPHLMVYDTIYTADRTPLMLAAAVAGARSANGLSMLLHQGALSFEIWFNRPAPLEAMRAALLKASIQRFSAV